jgi:acetylornithine deacetylase/succinyl-diaminopimelate desuccinylase-like protein
VADDTASLSVLLLTAKYFIENHIVPEKGILFVFNSCEEGLGNLKGVRKLFADYEGRIQSFITLDSILNVVADRCVGSHRYEVRVLTEGGHSFSKFGNTNAIAELSRIVTEIYKIQVPQKPGTKTTYNVGSIEGGTSVNTIAQSAKMLCEYRSDDMECLSYMQAAFEKIFTEAGTRAKIQVELLGQRPCGNTPPEKIQSLKDILIPIIEEETGSAVRFSCASTDCNIPLSLGIPALCIGANIHEGTHTRQEWVDKASMKTGLALVIRACLAMSDQ